MDRGREISDRLLRFGREVLILASNIPPDVSTRHLSLQVIRSATSTGANYAEARGASSRRDFVSKLRIADKEMREARYWLELICARWSCTVDADDLVAESGELVGILSASIRTASKELAG